MILIILISTLELYIFLGLESSIKFIPKNKVKKKEERKISLYHYKRVARADITFRVATGENRSAHVLKGID